jgi:hypothetical protein
MSLLRSTTVAATTSGASTSIDNSSAQPESNKRFGDLGAYGRGIAADSADNVLLTGYFEATVDFGGGPLMAQMEDIYLAKLDNSGAHLWSKSFGVIGACGVSVATDPSDDAVITVEFYGY